MISPDSFPRCPRSLLAVVACTLAMALPVTRLLAQDPVEQPPVVAYNPNLTPVQGQLPVVTSYSVTITAPLNLVSGVQVPVTFQITATSSPTGLPIGVDTTSYVSLATPANPNLPLTSLLFTQPGQSLAILVKVSIPADAVPGSYAYKIRAVGFPVDPVLGLTNDGTDINASVTAAAGQPQPPGVTLSLSNGVVPIPNGGQISTPFGTPVTINYSTTATGAPNAPITGLTAKLGAAPLTFTSVNPALGTAVTVVGQGQFQISVPGFYSVNVDATNSGGNASVAQSFQVIVTGAPMPRAFIDEPLNSLYTSLGGIAVRVPASFRAETDVGTSLQNWSAVLTRDGSALPVSTPSITPGTGNTTTSWTGTTPFDLSIPDRYTLTLTVNSEFGSATATKSFRINAQPVIEWSPAAITYGTALSSVQLNAVAKVGATTIPGTYTYNLASGLVLPAGTQTLSVSFVPDDTTNYLPVTKTVSLVVNKAPLTVTAGDATKVYGSANPGFTYSIGGFVNGETLATSGVTGVPSLATSAGTTSPVNTYPITPGVGSLSSNNYSFSFVNGTLAVTKAALTVTADDQSRAYGSSNPTLSVSYSGLLNGDAGATAVTSLVIGTAATSSSPVGTYPITLSGGASANYTLTLAGGTLTVTKAALTVTADDKSKVYGTANPALTVRYTGLVNGDAGATAVTNLSLGTAATVSSPVSSYPITLSGGTSTNYSLTLVAGTLTVTKAALTVKADDKSKLYGDAIPTLTVGYSGLVNGDTGVSAVTGLVLGTAATASSPAGTYPITVTGGTSANYSLTLAGGTLTVTKAALTVTADDKSKVYGTANPTLTATYAGLVNGDTAELLTGITISTTATSSSPVGTYVITPTGTTPNYNLTVVAGTLTVTKAALTITADNETKVYGTANPTLTATYAGLVNGDTASSLTGITVSTTATATSSVGSYPISVSGTAANYSVTSVAGTLTITRRLLTVTADAQTMTAGGVLPAFTSSVAAPGPGTGLVSPDTMAVLGTLSYSIASSVNTGVAGTYPNAILVSGPASTTNYAVTYLPGTLTVKSANVTVGGIVFLDIVNFGTRDASESGLSGITVNLYKGSSVFRSVTTGANGSFSFSDVPADSTYEVDVAEPAGLTPTDSATRTVSASLGWSVRDIGLALNFDAIGTMCANGFTVGYWKNNIDKALAGKTSGTQVSAATLQFYTSNIAASNFAGPAYNGLLMAQASAIMGSTSSVAANLLSKQLVASEYNYQNGAFFNGNRQVLTLAFVMWGEYVLQNAGSFSSAYLLWAKDWFDAYNNTHGGCVYGPSPVGTTSIAADFNGTAIAANNYIWFNAVVAISGRNTAVATTVQFNRSTATFNDGDSTPAVVDIPDNVITFDPAATMATTVYDSSTDTWRTIVPASYTGNVFLGGCSYRTPVTLAGGTKGVTWSGRFVSSTPNLTAQWKWAAAVYTQLNPDEMLVGAKPVEGNAANPYLNSDHAGTPELFKAYVIGGAMGGGGSNWTGSYSGTASVTVGQ